MVRDIGHGFVEVWSRYGMRLGILYSDVPIECRMTVFKNYTIVYNLSLLLSTRNKWRKLQQGGGRKEEWGQGDTELYYVHNGEGLFRMG
mmetsp:Transcript_117351/g.230238  ORF Transcript_117351/g.230238 Transcript_117351/m.230238 type:complete len:89 (-) Transcript_117351:1151-1417(-)